MTYVLDYCAELGLSRGAVPIKGNSPSSDSPQPAHVSFLKGAEWGVYSPPPGDTLVQGVPTCFGVATITGHAGTTTDRLLPFHRSPVFWPVLHCEAALGPERRAQ